MKKEDAIHLAMEWLIAKKIPIEKLDAVHRVKYPDGIKNLDPNRKDHWSVVILGERDLDLGASPFYLCEIYDDHEIKVTTRLT